MGWFMGSPLLKESDALCVQEPISSHGGAVLLRSPEITVARQRHPTRSVSRYLGRSAATVALCEYCRNANVNPWTVDLIKRSNPAWIEKDGTCKKCWAYYRNLEL